jgi:hypothetical protein
VIIRHSSGAITTKVAAEIASSLTVGIFSPISAQVDPLRLGVARRAIRIGLAYGNRLRSENVKSGTVEKLVNDYPAHGFVIDQKEATELFKQVRSFDDGEVKIFGIIDHILRIPDENGIVSDLRTDFSSQPVASNDEGNGADKGTMGVEDAEPHNEQPCSPAENSANGTSGAGGEH